MHILIYGSAYGADEEESDRCDYAAQLLTVSLLDRGVYLHSVLYWAIADWALTLTC